MCPPGTSIIKLFTVVINSVMKKAHVFATISHFSLGFTNALAFYITE
jgi:hypothetical protein